LPNVHRSVSGWSRVMTFTFATAQLVSLAALISSCGESPRERYERKLRENPPQFDGSLRRDASGYLVADFGSVIFRFSEDEKPVSVGPNFLKWHLRWSDHDLGEVISRIPTKDDLSRNIRVMVYSSTMPISLTCNTGADCGFMYWAQLQKLTGPHFSSSLNLQEYRRRADPQIATIYVAPDPKYIELSSGIRPFARCDWFDGSYGFEGLRQCYGQGKLSSDLTYQYWFQDFLLPEWQILDTRVREFLLSLTQQPIDTSTN